MKIALAHDFLAEYGGAERVLEALHEIWPKAPLFTAFYNPGFTVGLTNNTNGGVFYYLAFIEFLPNFYCISTVVASPALRGAAILQNVNVRLLLRPPQSGDRNDSERTYESSTNLRSGR